MPRQIRPCSPLVAPRRIQFGRPARHFRRIGLIALACSLIWASSLPGAVPTGTSNSRFDRTKYERIVAAATRYLESSRNRSDGSYSSFAGIGPTALVTTALLRHGRSPSDPLLAGSLKYLESHVQPDGGVYQEGTFYRNYETCVSMVCFQQANLDGRYDKILSRAEAFIKGIQWDEGEGKPKSDDSYGGAGYGKHRRPDLSNTAYLVDALQAAGNGPDDPAIQRALIFVSRCQNLETEHNTTPHASKNPDGGFYYTCANEGETKADQLPNGGLRSYGSMSYAGLKSMIYAGVSPNDPRVRAVVRWAQKYYTLDENPGVGSNGLYYYYHTFAKALSAVGDTPFVDAAGQPRNWRGDLVDVLAERQQPNGSWINENPRWLEGDPNLSTAYALLALSYAAETPTKTPAGETP